MLLYILFVYTIALAIRNICIASANSNNNSICIANSNATSQFLNTFLRFFLPCRQSTQWFKNEKL